MASDNPNKNQTHLYQFEVEGMTCAACVTNVETALTSIPGVVEVNVNLATEAVSVMANETIPINKLGRAVNKMGYKIEPKGSSSLLQRKQRAIESYQKLLMTQAFFGIPLLAYAMAEMFTSAQILSQSNGIVVQLILATILVASGAGYYRRGFRHLFMGAPNMDTLVALGTGAAYTYSLVSSANIFLMWNLPGFQTLYFEAAGTILLFITFGKWLEAMAKGKTTEALTGLMHQMPTEAEVFRKDAWQTVALDQIHIGDLIRVKPHSKIPVDGMITNGSTSVDESSISGESLPVEKRIHSEVIGASFNLQGTIELTANKIGRDSMFGQIISLVEEAQSKKPKIQKLVDKIAAVSVPIVISLAFLSGVTWFLLGYGVTFSIGVMISVLIIACPCALGLATPTALVVGSGIAARGGILIKSADAFQQLSQIDVMVFDKTGTLTESKPQLVATYPSENQNFINLAIGLDQHSQHPLAKAVLDYGISNSIDAAKLSGIQEEPGMGMRGIFQDATVQLRRVESDEMIDRDFQEKHLEYIGQGYTTSGVFKDDKILGLMAFSDTLKSEGMDVVSTLSKKGIEPVLLTGDKHRTAIQVASAVGISQIYAEVLPSDKHDHIRAIQARGKKVAMLGDGINDAPALVAADVGLSFREGTDIAINAADVIFLSKSLNNLVFAHRISQATISKIYQNLFWAFVYNLAGIPIAMGVLYPFTGTLLDPMFAGIAMAFSSVSVVSNTLLLRWRDYFKGF